MTAEINFLNRPQHSSEASLSEQTIHAMLKPQGFRGEY
jgi:hypothetical protein